MNKNIGFFLDIDEWRVIVVYCIWMIMCYLVVIVIVNEFND